MPFLASLLIVGQLSLFSTAHAQGYDDLDSEAISERERQEDRAPIEIQRDVREINKGMYAKTSIGAAIYLGAFSDWVQPGTALGLSLGKDFLNQERMSMAWEISFLQGIHNGLYFQDQVDAGCLDTQSCLQGDLRTYSIVGAVEYSIYINRRVGLGLRAGGGLLVSPVLLDETFYTNEVVGGAWGGNDFGFHGAPHPIAAGGPTFEYYTKLAHFSVGVDADFFYAIGFDLGTTVTGTIKYTF